MEHHRSTKKEHNTAKSQRRNGGQPLPLSGSKKTKQKNHVSQTNGEG
ncbi:small acid-soluble spore protein P [Alkalihalobacillus pseudalcaliphilus]|nr:small acid-soluble spore protein P [Alkalihalobacillus pseudalcaliphilus]KMK76580.1 spore protein [Alkalihalobacillus pseudalcaliphilus]